MGNWWDILLSWPNLIACVLSFLSAAFGEEIGWAFAGIFGSVYRSPVEDRDVDDRLCSGRHMDAVRTSSCTSECQFAWHIRRPYADPELFVIHRGHGEQEASDYARDLEVGHVTRRVN